MEDNAPEEVGDHEVPADLLEMYVAIEADQAGCFDPATVTLPVGVIPGPLLITGDVQVRGSRRPE